MEPRSAHDVTVLLHAWRGGDQGALDKLLPMLYRELHRIAKHHMAAQPPGHTLQTTALLNEACVHLIDAKQVNWQDRSHFLAVCSQVMRRILVDYARARQAAKRGGGVRAVPLEEALVISPERDNDILAVDEALNRLSTVDPRRARVVEMRFFGGLSVEETAAALDISTESVMRDWRLARAWLARELSKEKRHGRGALAEN